MSLKPAFNLHSNNNILKYSYNILNRNILIEISQYPIQYLNFFTNDQKQPQIIIPIINTQMPQFRSDDQLLNTINLIIDHAIKNNSHCQSQSTPFDCIYEPNTKFSIYMRSIYRNAKCSSTCLIISIVLLDRLHGHNPKFKINCRNVYKLFVVSLLIAIKMNQDDVLTNSQYSKMTGICVEHLNQIEYRFLWMIHFRAFVTAEIFGKYNRKLRGYFLNHRELENKNQSISSE